MFLDERTEDPRGGVTGAESHSCVQFYSRAPVCPPVWGVGCHPDGMELPAPILLSLTKGTWGQTVGDQTARVDPSFSSSGTHLIFLVTIKSM